MKIISLIFVFSIFTTTTAFGYSWTQCSSGSGPGNFLSSIQFTSSWGPCSLLGMMNEKDKDKMFIVHNLDRMMIDSARGGGEFIQGYASATGCEQKSVNHFVKATQTHFGEIYGRDSEKSPKEVYESLEKLISGDEVLRTGCHLSHT